MTDVAVVAGLGVGVGDADSKRIRIAARAIANSAAAMNMILRLRFDPLGAATAIVAPGGREQRQRYAGGLAGAGRGDQHRPPVSGEGGEQRGQNGVDGERH